MKRVIIIKENGKYGIGVNNPQTDINESHYSLPRKCKCGNELEMQDESEDTCDYCK